MDKSKIEVTINLDKGNDIWNENNPDKPKITRQDVYDNEGLTKTTIQNWKKGKVGRIFLALFKYLNRTGLSIEDIVEIKEKP